MATFTLRRFSNAEALKAIQPANLLALLDRFVDYFRERGVALVADGEPDYEAITRVLMAPDERTPKGLVDDLYFVHEMATPAGMDELQEAIARMAPGERAKLDLGDDPTPADVAVQVRLKAPALLERAHAEHVILRKRSFEYFQVQEGGDPTFRTPTAKKVAALEVALDDRLEALKRGRNSKVFVFEKPDSVWMLIRHGEPCTREGAVEDGGSSSVYYRPERYDVLKYNPETGELSINAENKKVGALFREKIGLHLFGDAMQFPGTAKYSLEPLRSDGVESLVCSDVEGMEWVRLKEIHYYWGGPEGEVEVRKASDLFAVFKRQGRGIDPNARIQRASFSVKFRDAKAPRTVTIRPSNTASYQQDEDAGMVEEWLRRRGFTRDAETETDARPLAAVANI